MSILAIVGSIFLLMGTLICIIGGIGLVRMPDFYTRAHAASVPDTLGAGLALLGMACFTMDLQGALDYRILIILKLLSISVLILVTSPIAGHAVAKAAFERGVDTNCEALALNINQLRSADNQELLEPNSETAAHHGSSILAPGVQEKEQKEKEQLAQHSDREDREDHGGEA